MESLEKYGLETGEELNNDVVNHDHGISSIIRKNLNRNVGNTQRRRFKQ